MTEIRVVTPTGMPSYGYPVADFLIGQLDRFLARAEAHACTFFEPALALR